MLASGTRAEKHGQAAEYLDQDSKPSHEVRRGHPKRLQNCGERIKASGQLGEAMLHKTVPDDQPQRDGGPTGHWRSAD
jgi:hypothetical protein